VLREEAPDAYEANILCLLRPIKGRKQYAPFMRDVDLNLLTALDALLKEGSVTGAARRLSLSFSAMSRTLSRLRETTGDPLLVRAGRKLVPTPHALALKDRVHMLAGEAHAVLQPAATELVPSLLDLTFTIRAGGGFVEMLSTALFEAVNKSAPGVRLRFMHRFEEDRSLLREGTVDLEISKRTSSAPEMRRQLLFRDKYVGVARKGHPLITGSKVTLGRYASSKHVASSHFGESLEPVDHALSKLGLSRAAQVVVPGYLDAMRVAAHSDLLAVVPQSCLGNKLLKGYAISLGLLHFDLPLDMPEIHITALWHPRVDADPAQRWLRQLVAKVCRKAYPGT
jgi:DNA-binding transcriptional LysR family regulator